MAPGARRQQHREDAAARRADEQRRRYCEAVSTAEHVGQLGRERVVLRVVVVRKPAAAVVERQHAARTPAASALRELVEIGRRARQAGQAHHRHGGRGSRPVLTDMKLEAVGSGDEQSRVAVAGVVCVGGLAWDRWPRPAARVNARSRRAAGRPRSLGDFRRRTGRDRPAGSPSRVADKRASRQIGIRSTQSIGSTLGSRGSPYLVTHSRTRPRPAL